MGATIVKRSQAWAFGLGALLLALLAGAPSPLLAAQPVTYPTFADPAFRAVWERYDRPVFFGQTARSYTWGNQISQGFRERYLEGPDQQHLVEYFDKSRMEINDPNGDRAGQFFVTQGLLARDMIRGEIQEGDAAFRAAPQGPARVPFGDLDDTLASSPTYASLRGVLDAPPVASGRPITAQIDRAGTVGNSADPRGVTSAGVVPGLDATNHSIPSVFLDFLRLSGPVYEDGRNVERALFVPAVYVTGLPITEAYWARVKAAGQPKDVLIQCFERRCLTYTPANPEAFRVELANTGLQYYEWRYSQQATPVIPTLPPVRGPATAETAHYRFYDADGMHVAQVATLAAEAEAVYAVVSERTGLSVPDPIPVVVQTPASSSCAARGAAYNGDGGGRIGIFADAQTSSAQLRVVLAHETAHILHFAAVQHPFDLTLGEGFATWAALPYWTAWQGFASFEEATRTYLADGRFVPLDNPPADCTIRSRDVIYNERASFAGYLIEAYGRDRLIAASATSVRAPWSSLGSVADYKRIYGKEFGALVEEWLSKVRAGGTFGLSSSSTTTAP